MFPINPIITYVVACAIVGGSLRRLIRSLLDNNFSHKMTMLTGPLASGKTTFLRYLSEDEIPEGPSNAPKRYIVKDAFFDVVTDIGGADVWLYQKFDVFIKEHDYILFFFSVYEFINDIAYRHNCFARLDFINNVLEKERLSGSEEQKIVLLVGTYIDKVPGFNRSQVESHFAGKPFSGFLQRSVYINTNNKEECLREINNALEN